MSDIERILIYGDPHLSSRNYGAHINYPAESLDCFRKITKLAEETQATMLVGLGDFTYGRFGTLEYREAVEAELTKQYQLVNGRHYQLKGNHDTASYGMTEYEYYIKKGFIKPSCNMTIGDIHITMVDYGQSNKTVPNIGEEGKSLNILFAHDFYRFKDTLAPDFGKYLELDNFEQWFGVDHIICGHIHSQLAFDGLIVKNIDGQPRGHRVTVQYPGSLPRPAYREGHMDLVGQAVLIVVKDNITIEYNVIDVELLPLEQAFNLSQKAIEKELKSQKEQRVDISDIIEKLNSHQRNVGNPEDIIQALQVDDKYKTKAIELLKLGQA